MKNLFFVLLLTSLTLAGCGNNSSNKDSLDHGDGSNHTHENGEMHQHDDTIQQQEFIVDPDSVMHE